MSTGCTCSDSVCIRISSMSLSADEYKTTNSCVLWEADMKLNDWRPKSINCVWIYKHNSITNTQMLDGLLTTVPWRSSQMPLSYGFINKILNESKHIYLHLSLTMYKPLWRQRVLSQFPSSEIGTVVAGRASDTPWVHGWADSHSYLCGCCRPASGHTVRGVSESLRVHQQLTNGSSNRELDKSKVQVLVIAFFIFLSAMSPRFSLVLDPN